MIFGAIMGGIIGGTIPWVLKTANKSIDTREGLILVAAYGAIVGAVLGLIF